MVLSGEGADEIFGGAPLAVGCHETFAGARVSCGELGMGQSVFGF